MGHYVGITAEQVTNGVDQAIEQAQTILDQAVSAIEHRTFENTLMPLDHISDVLGHANANYAFMGYVHPEEPVRAAGKDAEEKMSSFGVDMVFRDDLNQAVQEYAVTDDATGLSGERARFLEFVLRDLRQAGHELDSETRAQVKKASQRLVELGVRFQQNVDEWDDFITVDSDDLEGLPPAFAESLEEDDETGKLKVTLAYPHLIPFLENAKRRDLREDLRFKFNIQAVEDNRPILEEALQQRQDIAEAFGQPSWAHHRLDERMAKEPENVSAFYEGLLPPLSAQADKDIAEVSSLLQADTGEDQVEVWDWSYYDTLQRKTDYGVDPFEVAQYFPLPDVLNGMFKLTSEMFGISFRKIEEPDVWHKDVELYAIDETATGEELARFYLDLFPREGKFGHAAEFPLVPSRQLEDGTFQNPLCAMVANFTKPTDTAPSLLQHGEVQTFWHEFGHVLHQNLGRTELARFSGTNVERDFVEAPSQIMEHWIWRADILKRFARHHETGEPIPDALVERLVEARQLNISVHQLRQLQYGWWDQEMHGSGDHDLDRILIEGSQIAQLPHQEGTFALASFGHVMGGYDASYYGYMWSEVYGDDMFSRFEEEGVTNPEVGMSYRKEILGRGGSLDAEDMLLNFLGRKPDNAAFLRKLGITQ